MRPIPSLMLVLGLLPGLDPVAAAPIDIGSRRELFVDRFLIEELHGLELRLHHPTPAGPALELNRAWEGIVSGYVTVIQDGARYLMYYRGRPSRTGGDGAVESKEVACYAESADGIHWTRPNLGLHEVAGTKDNNVILVEPTTVTHNFAPFLDAKPGVPPQGRFKALGGTGASGLFGFVSPDGIHWQRAAPQALITEGAFDSQNIGFWSEHEQCYLCYFRTFKNGVRWVTRTTSPDFLHWTKPEDMSFGGAPPEHIYINQTQPYFRAPHLYIATAARFNPGRRALTDEQVAALDLENPRNYDSLKVEDSDAVLLSSRGGAVYDRTFLESFIRPGPDLRNWVARANYPALGVVPTGPTEMSMYVGRHYGQPSIFVERLTLRTDGFASVHASYSGGDLLTKPLRFSGRELEVNLSTSAAGALRVEMQDERGQPLPGFALQDCPEIIGDQIDRVVAWKQGRDVSSWAGRTVRLRFALKDADLFAFRFRAAAAPAHATLPAGALQPMLSITWKKGPDLPQGFQDSDGGIVGSTLVTVGGFCSGQKNVPGKVDKYPRQFLQQAWGLDLAKPAPSWQALPPWPGAPRQEHCAIVVDDQLYAWGGFSYTAPFCYANGFRLSRQGKDWAWSPLPALPWPISSAGLTTIQGKLYLMGGSDYDEQRFYTQTDRHGKNPRLGARLLVFDPQDPKAGWHELPACPGTPRFVHAFAAVQGRLFVVGGATGNDNETKQSCTVVDNWSFDPKTSQWERLADTPIATGNFPAGAIVFADRYLVLIGGYQYGRVLNPDGTSRAVYGQVTKHYPKNDYNSDVLVYDTKSRAFGTATPLPLCNNLPMAVLAGRTLHLIGGETGGCEIDGEKFGHHPDLYLTGEIQVKE